ncbi:MAG: dihydropteroate synthase [Acidobacteriota bacterium]
MRKRFNIELGDGSELALGERTLIVGVLNVTPDSFSDGGKNFDTSRAIERALEMQEEGADIIEIGGESTRPNSERIQLVEELQRLLPVLEGLRGKLSVPVSVDTYKSAVAREAIARGAKIINDVSALRFDEVIACVVAESGAALVLMHMRGEPATMQKIAPSRDIFAEIKNDMRVAIHKAQTHGVKREQLIFDPGIGFGKTLEQNLEILNGLESFADLDLPLMIGTSRKSFIGKLTGRVEQERVFGTAASVAIAIARGAHFVRVHDVKEIADVVKISDAIINA